MEMGAYGIANMTAGHFPAAGWHWAGTGREGVRGGQSGAEGS